MKRPRFRDLTAFVSNPRTLSSKLKLPRELGLVEAEVPSHALTDLGARALAKLTKIEELLRARPRVLNVERIPHAVYAPLIRKYCEKLYEVLGEKLVSVMLFGSVARGDWSRDSDIDFLVIAKGWEGKPIWENLPKNNEPEPHVQ